MKKQSIWVLMLSLVFVLSACGGDTEEVQGEPEENEGPEPEQEQITLRLAENQPEDYPTTIGDKEFARLVEEKTDGRIKIEVYAGGQLGDEKSVIEQVQLGSIELARVNVAPLTEFSEDIGVLTLPYLFDNEEHMWDVLNGEIGDELLATLEESNMIGLAYYDSGKRSFYNSKRLVTKPEDLEGLKIRVQQSEMFVDLVEALGASATPMAYEEVYSAIQTGVLDGAENNYPSYYSSNHYEVAEYFTIDGHSTVPEVVVASKGTWDELSEEDKQILREAAKESVPVQREAWADLVAEAEKAVEENGNEVYIVEDLTPWQEAVEPIYEKYGGQYQEWLDKIDETRG